MASMPSSSAPPLGKYFASTEKTVRDKAIKHLATFLSNSDEALPPPEMAKLWKGIFYCFWMSDKPLVQQALATELAELILTISSPHAALGFLDGFWQAHVREWGGIDRLRIDKYYMLVRRFINAGFRLLIRHSWAKDLSEEYNQILFREGGPLYNTPKIPHSLQYHLIDAYLEELDKALDKAAAESDSPLSPVPICTLLAPFLSLAAHTPKATTYSRIQRSLLDPLLAELATDDGPPSAKRARLSDDIPSDSAFSNIVSNMRTTCESGSNRTEREAIRSKVLRQIFDVASNSETLGSNRRKLYELWQDGDENEEES